MKLKEFSQACENNKNPILNVLKKYFLDVSKVLEIGSGTGQHAMYFADKLNWLTWQPTEIKERLSVLQDNCKLSSRDNLCSPLALNIFEPWRKMQLDAVFSANTLHITPAAGIEAIFSGIAPNISSGFRVAIYGPFKYEDEFTSESNAIFDKWLRSQNLDSGIRDFELVNQEARNVGLNLIEDFVMPANNQLLIFGA